MKVLITDYGFENVTREREILQKAGIDLVTAQCKTPREVVEASKGVDGLLVQWAPVTAAVIEKLEQCKSIVRYGIGVDNIDLTAARSHGIAVCNVPDYCLDEVADHSMAMALSLSRQLPQINQRVRQGVWKIVPDSPMPAFKEMIFATVGYGRIAQAVLKRAKGFGFQLAAYDPFAPIPKTIRSLTLDDLFKQADILSLHLPLTEQSRHFINEDKLNAMKKTAIVVNTARGGLIDTDALAKALRVGQIAWAGLDVFETEPLADDHPLRECPNVLLTSHVAWFSQASVPRLQRMAAQEIVRGLLGQPLQNQVNT